MLEARPGRGEDIDDSGRPADALRSNANAPVAIDDHLPGLGVKPHSRLERLEFILGQPVFGSFPNQRWLSDVGVTVKGGEILGHGSKLLDGHATPPYSERR